jgi:hypothetical protein
MMYTAEYTHEGESVAPFGGARESGPLGGITPLRFHDQDEERIVHAATGDGARVGEKDVAVAFLETQGSEQRRQLRRVKPLCPSKPLSFRW